MVYTKKKFGLELKSRLLKGDTPFEISKWAFKIYIEFGLEFEEGLDYFVFRLISMEEGQEFILPIEEIYLLANELIDEKEDLNEPED